MMDWLKKWWSALLGWGLVGLGFFFSVPLRRRPSATTPIGRTPEEAKVEEETAEGVREAERARDEQVAQATETYRDELDAVVVHQQDRTDAIADDPTAVNEYLKRTGREIRGDGSGDR